VRKKLDDEVAEKTKLVEDMTQQLDDHQQHLNELKDELSKTRKRQVRSVCIVLSVSDKTVSAANQKPAIPK